MLISASRRCDIPTYYSEWFFNRIREGFALVRNPVNFHQISRVSLLPEVVDGIVFWTKNPAPMMNRLGELKDYNYYFQFTVNPYGTDVEPNIPDKNDFIVPMFCQLSRQIGPERVVWRYDPIVLSRKYTVPYHLEHFEAIAKKLCAYTTKCTFSFLDLYKNTERNVRDLNLTATTKEDMQRLAQGLARIAAAYRLTLGTCAEQMDFSALGISRARCVDKRIFEGLVGCALDIGRDKNQRPECGCDESIDIGAYNACISGCRYCYANFNPQRAAANHADHDPASPLLLGAVGPEDVVKERKMGSCKNYQQALFEL